AIPLAIYLFAFEPIAWQELDKTGWQNIGAIGILAVVGTAIALILFNRLIQLSSAVFASTVTYLIPVVALIWGSIDGEPIGWQEVLGLGIVLTGVYLVNSKEKRKTA
ncbi:MAG: DMT family transporter, partial [Bacteroidetes bacterium]|nr:DMT family transporter [Bacteroidota bacterium]